MNDLKTLHMYQEIHEQPQAVKHAYEVNIDTIKNIAKLVKENNITNIIMVARGSSNNACHYFKYLCEIYAGIPVGFAQPSVTSVYGKNLKYKNTLMIGVSQSGTGVDVAEVLKSGNENGAMTLAVTNFADSLIATTAKYNLYLSCTKEISVAATKTFTVQMYLLGLLAAELGDSDELRNALKGTSDLLANTLKNEDAIFAKARTCVDFYDCFVLSRGINYVSNLESGLKLQETTYVKSKPFGVADFYHGPFAVIDNTQNVFLLHGNGVMNKDVMDMFNKLKEQDANVIVVTNDKAFANYENALMFEDCHEAISPFAVIETMQLFACQLSVAKGNCPDTPRGLHKVTITK